MGADELVTSHLYLVDEAVARYRGRCPPQELNDVKSDAQLALVEASRQFRGDRGAKFTMFARSKIRHGIIDGFRRRDSLGRVHRRQVGYGHFRARSLDTLKNIDHLLAVDGDLEAVENRDLFIWLMSNLSGLQRQAVTLRCLDGRSADEAARRMGITRSKVDHLVRSALTHLRCLVKGHAGPHTGP